MHIRKVSPAEAACWRAPQARRPRTVAPSPRTLRALLAALPDGTGLTRIDRAGAAGGEHAWRARVYTRAIELHMQFADARYGGAAGALRAAVTWRDGMRRLAGPRAPSRGQTPRIVRAESARTCGWLAYRVQGRRYFADAAWGGHAAGYATAARWLAGEEVSRYEDRD